MVQRVMGVPNTVLYAHLAGLWPRRGRHQTQRHLPCWMQWSGPMLPVRMPGSTAAGEGMVDQIVACCEPRVHRNVVCTTHGQDGFGHLQSLSGPAAQRRGTRARSGRRAGNAGSSSLLVVGVTGGVRLETVRGQSGCFEMGWIVLKWIGERQEALMDARCYRSLGRWHVGAGGTFDQKSDGRVEKLGEITDACVVCSTRLALLQL